MTDPVTVHTSTRIDATPPPAAIAWAADSDEGHRHAFPQRTLGFPPPAVCGVRWTVRFGKAGVTWCPDCVTTMREQLVAIATALAPVEAEDLSDGGHFAGMDR